MSNLSVPSANELVDQWLEAERNGNPFPVPFDLAWQIAGYSRKDSAKRKLPKRLQDKVFHISMENSGVNGGCHQKRFNYQHIFEKTPS